MLNRLQLFRNVGQFDSVNTAATIPLAPMTLAYAENGRGKTTLCAILRSLATGDPLPVAERRRLGATNPPHIVIDCDGGPAAAVFQNNAWNRVVPNMVVFDDAFVDENICSGLVVQPAHRQHLHEFILGAQGVALSRTLQQLIDRIEEHNSALRDRANAIPAAARGAMPVDDFCSLPPHADIDAAIAEAERNLAAVRNQEPVRRTPTFEAFEVPPIDIPGIQNLLNRSFAALDTAAAARVQAHFATLGPEGEGWVASGIEFIPHGAGAADGNPCPFCAQNLGGSELMQHYRAYFSDEYTALKHDLSTATAQLSSLHGGDAAAAFERTIRAAAERRQFWSAYTNVPELTLDTTAISATWTSARNAMLAALRAKLTAPLDPLQLSAEATAALTAYEHLRVEVASVSARLQQTNAAINLVKEQAAAGNTAALTADVARLQATKARHTPEVAAPCDAYLAEQTAKAATGQTRDAARAALEAYRQSIFPTYQAAINEYLRKFNAGFRLGQIESQNTRAGPTCTYNVLINNNAIAVSGASPAAGTPSFKNTLSAGDRNTLALAFFFASLDQDTGLADKIIVIDDPVSSLDEHRALTTVQELRRLIPRVNQVAVLSHNKPFLCEIWDGTATTLRAAIEIARDGDGSTIRAWDVNSDMITEHDRRHASLRNYIAAATPNNREVAQALRPVMEAFLRVAFPADFPPGSMLGNFTGICEQRLGTPRQILNQSDINDLRDLTEYANRFHHDTNPTFQSQRINDTELLSFVQRTLAFASR